MMPMRWDLGGSPRRAVGKERSHGSGSPPMAPGGVVSARVGVSNGLSIQTAPDVRSFCYRCV